MHFSSSTRSTMAALATLILVPGVVAAQTLAVVRPAPFRTWVGYEVALEIQPLLIREIVRRTGSTKQRDPAPAESFHDHPSGSP